MGLVPEILGFGMLAMRRQFQVRRPDLLVVAAGHLEVVDLLRKVGCFLWRLSLAVLASWALWVASAVFNCDLEASVSIFSVSGAADHFYVQVLKVSLLLHRYHLCVCRHKIDYY